MANERRAREAKGAAKFVLKGARFPLPETHREHLFFLGLGRILIPRAALFCEEPITKGIAVQTYRPIVDAIPFSDQFIHGLRKRVFEWLVTIIIALFKFKTHILE